MALRGHLIVSVQTTIGWLAALALLGACGGGASKGMVHHGPDAAEDVAPGVGKLVASPYSLQFSWVCPHTTRELEILLTNDGDGPLDVLGVALAAGTSTEFSLVGTQAATGELAPGASRTIGVVYSPVDTGSDTGDVRVTATGLETHFVVGLFGEGAGPYVQAAPAVADLGPVAVGTTEGTTVSIENIGDRDLIIQSVSLESSWPYDVMWLEDTSVTAGGTFAPGDGLDVTVRFRPKAYAPPSEEPLAELSVSSNDCNTTTHMVPVLGWPGGSDEPCPGDPTLVDVFAGKDAEDADVLFVVDDSDSMKQEQDKLADHFAAFIDSANILGIDYRIGVTTMDMVNGGGALHAAPGKPVVVEPGNWTDFLDNVKVGTDGTDDERGLAAAVACVTSPTAFGAHLRSGAVLSVIFVSDEPDGSEESVASVYDALVGAKGGEAGQLQVHAIVGPELGCKNDTGLWGPRYIELADLTGGSVASICEDDFSQAFEAFASQSFGAKTTFTLTMAAVPGTASVSVEGAPCPDTWSLSPDGKRVIFEPDSPCLPDLGDEVRVTYDMVCW